MLNWLPLDYKPRLPSEDPEWLLKSKQIELQLRMPLEDREYKLN